MRKIRLNDGTEYAVNRCEVVNDVLCICVVDTTEIIALVFTFCDVQKTETITEFDTDESFTPRIYTGFTLGRSFRQQENGVLIHLEKRSDVP